jgi:hypothetical protein
MFIFDFKIVFIKNFTKMAPTRVRFSPDFLQEQDFPDSMFFEKFQELQQLL